MKYEILRSFDTVEVWHVEASNEDEAIEIFLDKGVHHRTFDGPYDDSVSVAEIKESDDD